MKFTTFLHIAREGWLLLLPLLLAGALLSQLSGSVWPLVVAALLTLGLGLYFRDGERRSPPQPLALVAPADGRIVHRRECHDPYLDRAAIRIGIEVNRRGAYFLRAPTEGTLMEIKGSRTARKANQASWIRTDEDDDIVMVVTEGSLLGLRPCTPGFGQRVGQGRRCGLRRLARRIDLFIPATCRVDVELGQSVQAATDVLATMVHNAPVAAVDEAA